MAVLLLAALGFFLVGICFHAQGARAGGVALGTTLLVVAALAWGREALFERCVCRLARQMGLPRDLRVVVSADGILEESAGDSDDPSRVFAWPDVVDVSRVDHLTVIRLRPAGGVLIVPDSAFAAPEGRLEFEEALRSWRGSAPPVSANGDEPRLPG